MSRGLSSRLLVVQYAQPSPESGEQGYGLSCVTEFLSTEVEVSMNLEFDPWALSPSSCDGGIPQIVRRRPFQTCPRPFPGRAYADIDTIQTKIFRDRVAPRSDDTSQNNTGSGHQFWSLANLGVQQIHAGWTTKDYSELIFRHYRRLLDHDQQYWPWWLSGSGIGIITFFTISTDGTNLMILILDHQSTNGYLAKQSPMVMVLGQTFRCLSQILSRARKVILRITTNILELYP